MILKVKFTYEAQVVRRRKQSRETALYADQALVEVAEASATEAPIAVTYREDDEATVSLRYFDGRLWEPRNDDKGRQTTAVDLRAEASDPRVGRGGVRPQEPYSRSDAPAGASEADDTVREFVSSDAEERRDAIRDLARDLLVVDGQVWAATEEPTLELTHSTRDGYAFVHVRTSPGRDAASTFRLDQADQIRALARIPDDVEIEAPHVEVFVLEAIRYPADEMALLAAGRQVLGRMEQMISEGDRDFFSTYATLRDAHREAEKTVNDPDRDFGSYVEAIEAGLASGEFMCAHRAKEALTRWDATKSRNESNLLAGM